ncbi:Retrovirus-related Pol polyprotein from transposon [Dictyocoela muelleri]|nr:Retrovirus-related Pol polyprotein from transposon [Dictyocoela muelleri]
MSIFSKIDLKLGYYQVSMDKESIKYTAFSVENKRFEWLRMPFGLTNAPKTFQKIMDKLFEEIRFAIPYLDDIIIFSKSHEEHITHIMKVLKILNDNNIKLNLEKCEFMKDKISFLGHNITREGILPIFQKIPMNITKTPKRTRDLRRILGILNYYREFINNFSEKTLFISDKIASKEKVQWTEKDKTELKSILEEIEKADALNFPDLENPFSLYTDASDRAIGAFLKQDKYTIAHYSHKLTKSERNYSVIEKEALGIIKATTYFRSMIVNKKVVIYTDNVNLIYNKDLSTRLQR